MGSIRAFSKEKKSKVKVVGKTLDLLALLVSISECLAEIISKEKELSLEKAESFVIDCIKDGMKAIKND